MIRNLILVVLILLFWLGQNIIYNSVSIISHEKTDIDGVSVYMYNKDYKIQQVEKRHTLAKSNYIFTKMIANNNEGIVNSLVKNSPRFLIGNEVGPNVKFNKFIEEIKRDLNLNIDFKSSIAVPGKPKTKAGFNERYYELDLYCEYEDLVAFVSEIEKSDRIYNIIELVIKNSPEQNFTGIIVEMKLAEINIGSN